MTIKTYFNTESLINDQSPQPTKIQIDVLSTTKAILSQSFKTTKKKVKDKERITPTRVTGFFYM